MGLKNKKRVRRWIWKTNKKKKGRRRERIKK